MLATFPNIDPGHYGVPGIEWPVDRTPTWSNITQMATSGKEFRLALWAQPRWKWKISYSYLPDMPGEVYNSNIYSDLRTIEGFFLQQQGTFGQFLFLDPHDNTATNQQIGIGDGTTTQFQLVSNFGGFLEWIQQPTGTVKIYLNSVLQGGGYAIAPTGIVVFGSAPAPGVVITVTCSYYFTARFDADEMTWSEFMWSLYECKECSLISVKL